MPAVAQNVPGVSDVALRVDPYADGLRVAAYLCVVQWQGVCVDDHIPKTPGAYGVHRRIDRHAGGDAPIGYRLGEGVADGHIQRGEGADHGRTFP